jgi:hypothetical protein
MFDIRSLWSPPEGERMLAMERSTVIRFADRRAREQLVTRARDARRRLEPLSDEPPRPPGRAWINGIEVGGGNPRWDHLAVVHD